MLPETDCCGPPIWSFGNIGSDFCRHEAAYGHNFVSGEHASEPEREQLRTIHLPQRTHAADIW